MRRFGVGLVVLAIFAWLAPVSEVSASTGWTVVPSPNVVIQHGSLAGISCPSPTDCEAVGSSTNRAGTGVVLAEAWNGTGWSVQPTPNRSKATFSSLSGVACSTASACTAVGSYYNGSVYLTLAESWNGTGWSIQSTPNPTGASRSILNGISCADLNACMAVGSADNLTLVEVWNGTRWHQANGATGGSLSGISCTAPTACTAVGSSGGLTLAEAWDGTTWSIQATPNPSGSLVAGLSGVACPTSSNCTAVGSYYDGSNMVALAEAWDGTSWNIEPTPNPTGTASSSLSGVACHTASACSAVGSYSTSTTTGLTLAEGWNGTSWNVEATPNPAGAASSALFGISCTAATTCMAVGSYSKGFAPKNLAETWNGARWSLQRPIGALGEVPSGLVGVSCSSATACVAVGGVNTLRGARGTPQRMLTEVWNGTRWTFAAAPNPAGAIYSNLSGVACPTTAVCIAVGGYSNGTTGVTLAEAWNGAGWSADPTPNPAGATSSGLSAISCSAATACMAVGSYSPDGSTLLTLAESWNGTSWSLQPTPNPAGATFNRLSGVACFTATACTAVGTYYNGSKYLTLAEAWDGTGWTIQPTPNLAGAFSSSLSGVACPSASACTAVGSSHGSKNVALAEAWDGTSWTIQHIPTPSGGAYPDLSGISCIATTQCTAVGSYSSSDFSTTLTLAEAWNGTGWSRQPTRNRMGATTSVLAGISCPVTTQCMAVGADVSVSERTLAEMWSG